MRWTRTMTAWAAVCLGLVAACDVPAGTAQVEPGAQRTSSPGPVSAALDPTARGPAPPIPGARRGGTLTVISSTTPASLDPSAQYYQDTSTILNLTHRSLTTFAMRDGRMVLVPDLATDLGRRSADGLTWTFTLKEKLRYEDGSPVRAADVVFAAKRTFDPDLAASGPRYQLEYFAGGETYRGPYQGEKDWAGVEAPDERTVVFHLAKRFESLPYFVSFTQFSPIPQAKDTKRKYQRHPVATGPYRFESYTTDYELVLKRNPYWDPATDPARHDYPDGYRFLFGQDVIKTQTVILASSGDDATSLNWDAIDASRIAQIEGDKKAQFVEGPSSCVLMVNLDATKIPLAVRRAVAVAWPFDSIHKALGETTHSYSPVSGILPPQFPDRLDYTAEAAPGFPMNGRGDGDPALARKLLAAAGYGPGKEFQLVYYYPNNDAAAQKMNTVRKQRLEAAGFRVLDIGAPAIELRATLGKRNGRYNMLQWPRGWCFDWPSADSIIPPTFGAAALGHGGTTFGNTTDPRIDAEIQRILELPIAEQGKQWGAMDKWLTEEFLYAIPDAVAKGNAVFGTKVRNVVNNPNLGMPFVPDIWLEP